MMRRNSTKSWALWRSPPSSENQPTTSGSSTFHWVLSRTRIEKALEDLCACVGQPDRVPAADILFHRSIYDASHNAILKHLGSLMAPLMHKQVILTTEPSGSFEKGLPLHRKVTEAIARRDPVKAELYSRELVNMPYADLHAWTHSTDRGLLP